MQTSETGPTGMAMERPSAAPARSGRPVMPPRRPPRPPSPVLTAPASPISCSATRRRPAPGRMRRALPMRWQSVSSASSIAAKGPVCVPSAQDQSDDAVRRPREAPIGPAAVGRVDQHEIDALILLAGHVLVQHDLAEPAGFLLGRLPAEHRDAVAHGEPPRPALTCGNAMTSPMTIPRFSRRYGRRRLRKVDARHTGSRPARNDVPGSPDGWRIERRPVADRARLMARTPLFRGMAPEQLGRLAARASTRAMHAGEVLCRRGEPGITMMVILLGQVRVVLPSPDGREQVLRVLHPGEVIGEMALLDGGAARRTPWRRPTASSWCSTAPPSSRRCARIASSR